MRRPSGDWSVEVVGSLRARRASFEFFPFVLFVGRVLVRGFSATFYFSCFFEALRGTVRFAWCLSYWVPTTLFVFFEIRNHLITILFPYLCSHRWADLSFLIVHSLRSCYGLEQVGLGVLSCDFLHCREANKKANPCASFRDVAKIVGVEWRKFRSQ